MSAKKPNTYQLMFESKDKITDQQFEEAILSLWDMKLGTTWRVWLEPHWPGPVVRRSIFLTLVEVPGMKGKP